MEELFIFLVWSDKYSQSIPSLFCSIDTNVVSSVENQKGVWSSVKLNAVIALLSLGASFYFILPLTHNIRDIFFRSSTARYSWQFMYFCFSWSVFDYRNKTHRRSPAVRVFKWNSLSHSEQHWTSKTRIGGPIWAPARSYEGSTLLSCLSL